MTGNTLSQKWTNAINAIRLPIMRALLVVSGHASANPKLHIVGAIVLSFLLLVAGLMTNFSIDVDEDVVWTPQNTRPIVHNRWIEDHSGFPLFPRNHLLLIHADGQNVVSKEGLRRAFVAIDTIRNTTGYEALCVQSPLDQDCDIVSVTQYWNNSIEIFQSTVQSDADVMTALSRKTLPDGTPADLGTIFGFPEYTNNGTTLTFAQAFLMAVALPDVDGALDFESDSLERLLDLKDLWEKEPGNVFRVEAFAQRSFSDEFTRAVVSDIPLVPAVFVVMSIFTCAVFFRRDWVFSRSLLGYGAVVCVLLSIMTGYGLLFLIGVPFTSMTQVRETHRRHFLKGLQLPSNIFPHRAQILPFIMFGIGLDDAFIISGAYARTDKTKTPEERVQEAIEEVGLSVTLTTLTSVLAFGLGCLSSVPAVYWLCLYAFPTIFIDFVYQITFFVALIIIDERRVANKRRDCLVCCTVQSRVDSDETEREPKESALDRFMGWYAEKLFIPWVKALVLVTFTALLGGCAYSATQLTQEFDFTDVVPSDSYVTDFFDVLDEYTRESGVRPFVYFRFVDQSLPEVQDQMEAYVADLVALPQVSEGPPFFWLKDFKIFVNKTSSVHGLAFNDKLTAFLEDSVYHELYADAIVRSPNGDIVASRTQLIMDNVNAGDVVSQVGALEAQREVTSSQPINQGRKDWAFFTLEGAYFIWEFYAVAPDELTLTTIYGVVAVTAIALFFIPHWSAPLFVLPTIAILYVDLLGVLQFAGLHVNAVSYVALGKCSSCNMFWLVLPSHTQYSDVNRIVG